MVRLGAPYKVVIHYTIEISIPVWCDWEDMDIEAEYKRIGFQFQYGAIGSSIIGFQYSKLSYFNSSMVRLGGNGTPSILILALFQFQYGAIGSINHFAKI